MTKPVRNTKNKILRNLLVISVFLLLSTGVEGAILYLEPSEGQYQFGGTFIVKIRIDTQGECINTVKADLEFPKAFLEAVDFSEGNSILIFWVKRPEINQESGLISFSGGIPAGYCGEVPGDPGESNLLGRIVFRVVSRSVSPSFAEVVFGDDLQVLLNDGLGTPAKLNTKGAVFTILPGEAKAPKDEWILELGKDTIPPEPFEIEIHQEKAIFEGKYFIAFFTTDKQTGLDYFEVKEGRRGWERISSPYLLKDQSLQSIIKVRAVDKAGNERIAEIIPPKKPFPWWTIIIIIGLALIAWVIAKLRKTLRETTRKSKL